MPEMSWKKTWKAKNNMARAIVTAFHKYQPYGEIFYEPILDFFLQTMKKYQDEYDHVYLVDSNWNISPDKLTDKMTILRVNPHLRYYDAYKEVLPQIKEDLVLFMDNDTIVYKPGIIKKVFAHLDIENLSVDYKQERCLHADVVSIYDTIGEWHFSKLGGKSKVCPYLFGIKTDLLRQYTGVEWGPNMPVHETLGALTKALIENGRSFYEMEEDKSNFLFESTMDGEKSKDLGYYHVRAGSTPAYLLAERKYGNKKTYDDYLKNQPKSEYLRQFAWYWYMCDGRFGFPQIITLLDDLGIDERKWMDYQGKFVVYHGLV